MARRPRRRYVRPVPTWSVTAEVDPDRADDLAAELVDRGARGVEERDASLAPMPGARRPAAGRSLLVAWFDARTAAEAAARALGPGAAVDEVADEDWGEAWKRGLRPFSVGRVFIRPSWSLAAVPPGQVEVVLDPGMAFGTGTHPTTALCLAALDAFLARRPGASVLDVGTGSGLLAIAAAKLGSRRVVATDRDPVAVAVARENAARNGGGVAVSGAALAKVDGPFDLVVANILANTLVELAPALARQVAPGGLALLSGIVEGQEEEVRAAFRPEGLVPAEEGRDHEWVLVRLRRPA